MHRHHKVRAALVLALAPLPVTVVVAVLSADLRNPLDVLNMYLGCLTLVLLIVAAYVVATVGNSFSAAGLWCRLVKRIWP